MMTRTWGRGDEDNGVEKIRITRIMPVHLYANLQEKVVFIIYRCKIGILHNSGSSALSELSPWEADVELLLPLPFLLFSNLGFSAAAYWLRTRQDLLCYNSLFLGYERISLGFISVNWVTWNPLPCWFPIPGLCRHTRQCVSTRPADVEIRFTILTF